MKVEWAEGERRVRWTHGAATVEKEYAEPPRSVVAWDGHVLVVEAMPGVGEAKDNAVVFDRDGAERVRLRPPKAGAEEGWVIGFHAAYLDELGRPIVVIATQVGDRWGRVDIEAGTIVDARRWH
jgi:hypothetical protein